MDFQKFVKDLPIAFFNTETRKKEPFSPITPGSIKMYTCGPTVYDYAHIGNFRTYVFEDLLRRSLELFGLKVIQVMNLTDVDDKTIKGAIETNQSLDDYTLKYKEAFFSDIDILHIQRAAFYPAATEYIDDMIDMIESLLEKGVAYEGADKSIYFSISKFKRYGCLSHLVLDELKKGASNRVLNDEYDKEHASDFVLWKSYDKKRDGNIFWDSPFGQGRPGWHLECSTMAMKLLDETIDIHVGGVDNIFPHHENEIAQSESYTSKKFVNLWMHSEHLIVNNKKMSKSLGNFYTLRDLLEKGYSAKSIRYLLMQTHYKTQLNFTFEGLVGASHAIDRLDAFIQRMYSITQKGANDDVAQFCQQAFIDFARALADDLNISSALAAIYNLIREINTLCDENRLFLEDAKLVLSLMKKFDSLLNVINFQKQNTLLMPLEIKEALEKREDARKSKDFEKADYYRNFITSKGYLLEDTPQGPIVKQK